MCKRKKNKKPLAHKSVNYKWKKKPKKKKKKIKQHS